MKYVSSTSPLCDDDNEKSILLSTYLPKLVHKGRMSEENTQLNLTHTQMVALAEIPKASSMVSILGSMAIILSFLQMSNNTSKAYHRIIFMMSVFDVMGSITYFLSTWPMPASNIYVYGAAGTQGTCTAQGFFQQFSFATVFYNAALCLVFYLSIVLQWHEDKIRRYEPYIHAVSIIIPFITAVVALPLELYNSANLWCWYAAEPPGCVSNPEPGSTAVKCIRGVNAQVYQFAFFFGPLWALGLFIFVVMTYIYISVLKQEKRLDNILYSTYEEGQRPTLKKRRNKSRAVLFQAVLYVLAFCVTWVFATVNRIYQAVNTTSTFTLLLLQALFAPCQGFLNFFIYFRPRFLKFKEKNESLGWCMSVYVFFKPIFCCLGEGDDEEYENRHVTETSASSRHSRLTKIVGKVKTRINNIGRASNTINECTEEVTEENDEGCSTELQKSIDRESSDENNAISKSDSNDPLESITSNDNRTSILREGESDGDEENQHQHQHKIASESTLENRMVE